MIASLMYIMNANGFWQAMGWTISCGVFIGATLYNGDLSKLGKGLIALLPYTAMLTMTSILRISVLEIHPGNQPQAMAGIATLLVITVAYVLGLFLGVITVHFTKGMKHETPLQRYI